MTKEYHKLYMRKVREREYAIRICLMRGEGLSKFSEKHIFNYLKKLENANISRKNGISEK